MFFSDLNTYVNGLPASDDSIDAFVMLSYRNNMAGTLGIAWGGTTCYFDKQYRSSITEYYQTQQLTATVSTIQKCQNFSDTQISCEIKYEPQKCLFQTVAHELAHNLGVDHDFIDPYTQPSTQRTCTIKSAPDNVCTNVGGIMDYNQVLRMDCLNLKSCK